MNISRVILAISIAITASCAAIPAPSSAVAASASQPIQAQHSGPAQQTAVQVSAEAAQEAALQQETDEFPAECAIASADMCLPPAASAKRLCSGHHPDAALAMFAAGSPWTRLYLRGKVLAWNASGGPSSQVTLPLDEEVIAIRRTGGSAGAMIVSGTDNFDVMRWDGTCVSLQEGEVTRHAPHKPAAAQVIFRDLDESVQLVLLEDARILELNKARRRECMGARLGQVNSRCDKVNEALSHAIVRYVRKGGPVPRPESLPGRLSMRL